MWRWIRTWKAALPSQPEPDAEILENYNLKLFSSFYNTPVVVGAAAVLCPAPEHVEVAPVRVHGAVAGRVGEVGRVLPAGRGRAQVQLAAVLRLLAATQPQPLGGLHMSCGTVNIATILPT